MEMQYGGSSGAKLTVLLQVDILEAVDREGGVM